MGRRGGCEGAGAGVGGAGRTTSALQSLARQLGYSLCSLAESGRQRLMARPSSAVHSPETDEDGHAGGGGGRVLLSSEPGAPPPPLSGPDPKWPRWEEPAARRVGGGALSGETVVVILKRCAAGVEVRMRTYRGSSP